VNSWWDEQTDQRRTAIAAVLDSPRGQHCRDHADGDRGFAAWLLVADVTCTRRLGVSIFDLSDWSWRGAYESGEQPGAALCEALEADDTFAMLLGGQE